MFRYVLQTGLKSSVGDPEPQPDLLVTSTDPAPDPSIMKQKEKKTLISTVL
jgi:hypothetical protein